MILNTSRFGQMEVDQERLISFPEGILGFPNQKQFALIQTGTDSAFYWLQSVDRAELAFVVCDPRLFIADYKAPIKADDAAGLELQDPADAQVFIVVNKVGEMLTGNLQGPLVINVATRTGKQLVLSDKRYSTRHPLMRVPAKQAKVQTA